MGKTISFIGEIQRAKGVYLLLVKLPEARTIAVGSLKLVSFPAGNYAYVGSALGGLVPRLKRHLQKEKKLHWHIDHLLKKAVITGIIIAETEERAECSIARVLQRQFKSVKGFGSSDCRCSSHLFYDVDENQIREGVLEAMTSHSLNVKVVG